MRIDYIHTVFGVLRILGPDGVSLIEAILFSNRVECMTEGTMETNFGLLRQQLPVQVYSNRADFFGCFNVLNCGFLVL